jgi:phage pi2 protein 07
LINNLEIPSSKKVLAGDLDEGWDATSRLSERCEAYSTLKERTSEFTDWARDGGIPQFDKADTKLFRKIENCASYLIFRTYPELGKTRLLGTCSCKEHLLCAFCAARRGVRNAVAYQERVESLLNENPYQQLMFVTFTVKNGSDLFGRFTHLKNSITRFLKKRNNALARPELYSSFSSANGGVFAYEFKRGSNENLWHPHIHMLLLQSSDSYIDIQAVKDEWQEITGDSCVVNIKKTTDMSAFLEVFAYALKFSELEHVDRLHAFRLLKGERLISSFGSFRNVEIPDSNNDDQLENAYFYDSVYRFMKHRGYFLHDTISK